MAENTAYARHKARRDSIWNKRSGWTALYRDAYDFAIPQRRPGGDGRSKAMGDRIFDMTATLSSMYFAGSLQRDLFPAGQPPFTLKAGVAARLALGDNASALDRELSTVAKTMHPFFMTGDWDSAIHELCIDLGVGTGAILPVKGTRDNPIIFASIPFDEIAIGVDAWGRTNFVSWMKPMERQAIMEAWPEGNYSASFRDAEREKPHIELTVHQDWAKLPTGGWRFTVSIQGEDGFVAEDRTRTQPIAVPRYYRVPGEAYGRGPILLALPSIKTLNKAQELALRAASIQLLGIWGYREGGTFNPDTVTVGPGQFWPMQSTGGILGPDVQRIDPASGRIDVGRMVIGNLQEQIKAVLFDTRLPENEGTPRSASEIVARLRQKSEVHIGAFGRLVNEIMPVVVPRVAEILYEFGYIPRQVPIDQLLVAISVQSPMAAALNAERLASIANYIEMVGAVAGQQNVQLYAHVDKVLEKIGDGLQIEPELIPTPQEREKIQQAQIQQQVALLMAQAAAGAGGAGGGSETAPALETA